MSRAPAPASSEGAPAKASLLVVDDDRLVLSTLASGLERLGYRVTSAVSGASAREAAATQRFDLAVLDVRLADDDGLELAQQLRAREPLPIVFLSAFDDRAYVERAVSEGGFAYLVKPVTPAQLAPLIESVLARCRDLSASRRSEDTLRGALAREREVSLAVGLIMERQRMSAHDAFELLRRRARNERRRVADVAREVIGAAEALNALGSPTLDVPPAPDE